MTSTSDLPDGFVGGNLYDKYRTSNPIYRRLMQGFLDSAVTLLQREESSRILEVGCGPGDLNAELMRRVPWIARSSRAGLDVSAPDVVAAARTGLPALVGSAYRLPFDDSAFDCVVVCEVLEHLEEPGRALQEISRVASDRVLFSVPWEPIWRILNVARGKYLGSLGNTPGHLQHFSRRSLRMLVSEHFRVLEEVHPFPWTMLLARKSS